MTSISNNDRKDVSIFYLCLTNTSSLVAFYKDTQCLTDNRIDTSTTLNPMHRPSWSIDNRNTCQPLNTHASLIFIPMHSHSRRPAGLTQADIAGTIRAAKQAGAAEVEFQ